jgi:uncharacterized protein with NRDE domain
MTYASVAPCIDGLRELESLVGFASREAHPCGPKAPVVCTLLVWKNRHPRYPIIVAANRDEFEGRPASDPVRLNEHPLVVGGRDEVAGGTWLAVSELGLIVALTNRRGAGRRDPAKRSRGLLVLECARRSSLDEIGSSLRDVDARTYNPFVLVALDPHAGLAAQAGEDGLHIAAIADGVHAVTNWDFDDERHAKARRALELARTFDIARTEADALAHDLQRLLADHAPGERGMDGGLCVHRPEEQYGTRSTAIVMLEGTGRARFFYGRGHPCENGLTDVSALLAGEDSVRAGVEP